MLNYSWLLFQHVPGMLLLQRKISDVKYRIGHKGSKIIISMFSSEHNHLKTRIVVFLLPKNHHLFQQKEQVLFHRICNFAQPQLYSSSEEANQTLTLKRPFQVFWEFCGHPGLSSAGWGKEVQSKNLITWFHQVLKAGLLKPPHMFVYLCWCVWEITSPQSLQPLRLMVLIDHPQTECFLFLEALMSKLISHGDL